MSTSTSFPYSSYEVCPPGVSSCVNYNAAAPTTYSSSDISSKIDGTAYGKILDGVYYLEYQMQNVLPTSSVSYTASGSSSSPTGGVAVAAAGSTDTSSSSASAGAAPPLPPASSTSAYAEYAYPRSNMLPAMIGGIVGGVVLVLLLVGSFWYRRVKKRRTGIVAQDGAMVEDDVEKGRSLPRAGGGDAGLRVVDLADVLETSSSSGSETAVSTQNAVTPISRPRMLSVAARTMSETSRPASMWTDDSEMDVVANDGSSYTRTLSTHSSTSTLHALPLSPTVAAGGTYMSTRSARSHDDSLDHPGYTYQSVSSTRSRPALFGVDTAISPSTTIFNPFLDSPAVARPPQALMMTPSPPYSAISPTSTYRPSSASGSGSGSGRSVYSQLSHGSGRSPLTPLSSSTQTQNPFADPAYPRRSLESIQSVRSEVPPPYAALYREDGTRVE